MERDIPTPGCISCGRPTLSLSGFCWQHSDMVQYLPAGDKVLITFESGKRKILLTSEIEKYQKEHVEAIFARIEPYLFL